MIEKHELSDYTVTVNQATRCLHISTLLGETVVSYEADNPLLPQWPDFVKCVKEELGIDLSFISL